jgi:branched-chain amino acid transport system substrate-binding protein
MSQKTYKVVSTAAISVAIALSGSIAMAEETIKLGLSVPLSGSAANWGIGSEFMCKKAAEEIRASGGVKVQGKTYNFECIAYDNKYNAAEGTKVAQLLLNRDGVKFIGGALGTAPVKALQSLAERQGALLFTVAWGKSLKGPDHPGTFTQQNTPFEVLPPLTAFIAEQHPNAKSVVMLNPNDATGQETEVVASSNWGKVGAQILASDYYERGTTEFQPMAARIVSLKPAIVDLGATPTADAGAILKELVHLGWDGVKVATTSTGADALKATGGDSVDGTYMGAGVVLDGPEATAHQKKLNEEAFALLGESLNTIQIGFYDSAYALKAAIEKADSIDPRKVAEVMPSVKFKTFYGGEVGFYGEKEYGTNQQMRLPVLVTQVQKGKLVLVKRLNP